MTPKAQDDTIRADPYPHLIVEHGRDDEGVGSWVPERKHKLLCDYLWGTRHAWAKWPARIYLDPFSGPGRIQVRGESFTREGGAVRAWHTFKDEHPFTNIYVGDLERKRVDACRLRLEACGARVTPFPGKAEETVPKMVAAVPRGSLSLAFIDPYNLELLSFAMLQQLATLQVDLVINFSTMDLSRNVELDFDRAGRRFDGVAPGWRDDPEVNAASKPNVKLAFFRYWCNLVKGLGFDHSKEMPVVENDHGKSLYRMVCFTRHPLPNRIWSDVARGPNFDLGF